MPDRAIERENVVFLDRRPTRARGELLDSLFREHGKAIRCFLIARVDTSELADDVLQEVFLRLAKIDDLESKIDIERGSTRGYLFSIATNLLIDRMRHRNVRRRYREMHHSDSTICQITPEQTAAAEQDVAKSKAVIMKLSPKCQRAFLLSRFDNLSYARIAEEMNLSVKAIEYYISMALKALRQEIER